MRTALGGTERCVKRASYQKEIAAKLIVAACCLLFIFLGLVVLQYPGLQNDEALFASVLYEPLASRNVITVFDYELRTMLMNYLGTLKSLLFEPIFWIWQPSVLSIRLPALLMGAATIWLTFVLVRRAVGLTASLAAVALLSTDPTFLLTDCFDWGPVALQHFLLIAGSISLLAFHTTGKVRNICLGFFIFGLAMWDKALFSWSLAGLGVAAALAFPQDLLACFGWRNAILAVVSFAIGSLPLLQYNIAESGETFRANAVFTLGDAIPKLPILRDTLNGSAMLGYMSVNDTSDHPRPTTGRAARIAGWMIERAGPFRTNLNWIALLVALMFLPILWRTTALHPLLFFLIFLCVTWFLMAVTGGGWAAHHGVLLWPFPFLFIATAFAAASGMLGKSGRFVLVAVIGSMVCANLLVYAQNLAQFARNGAAGTWTDAVFSLSQRLPQFGERKIYVIDWGMLNSLRLLNQGQLALQEATYPLTEPELNEQSRKVVLAEIGDPAHMFVGHLPGFEIYHGVGAHLVAWAREAGYERVLLETVPDRNGRLVFEIFRFARAAAKTDQNNKTADR